jgi:hypothetical protein
MRHTEEPVSHTALDIFSLRQKIQECDQVLTGVSSPALTGSRHVVVGGLAKGRE